MEKPGIDPTDSIHKTLSDSQVLSDGGAEECNIFTDYYRQVVDGYTIGPQVEGLSEAEITPALEDERISSLEHPELGGPLPFLVPVEYAYWLNNEFLTAHGYNEPDYCVLPQALVCSNPAAAEIALRQAAVRRGGSVSVIIDYPETITPAHVNFTGNFEVDDLPTENGTPAATYHYETVCRALPEAVETFEPNPAIRRMSKEEIETSFERIWDIYSRQFQGLVDDHPIAGALPKEALHAALMDEGCRVLAYFDENGLQAFGYLVTNIESCPWLNPSYFDELSRGLPLVYWPGIATAPEAKAAISTPMMKNMLHELLTDFGDFVLTFECSNKSAQYIPKLVERAFKQAKLTEPVTLNETKHLYKVLTYRS